MNIIGAGLSGLICGALNAQSHIYERNGDDYIEHRAVLRFRDDKIARALGLAFRRVTVHKAIWWAGEEVPAAPRFANWYSRKVRGIIGTASIWNIAPSERYIAPPDFHAILADICGARVHWNSHIDAPTLNELTERGPVVSTIPIPLLLQLLPAISCAPLEFKHAPIVVDRYTIPNCDVFQTVYFPDPESALYRATLTGNLLTVESLPTQPHHLNIIREVLPAFGLRAGDLVPQDEGHHQRFGKIVPVDDEARKSLLHGITQAYNIYSLGRFATWRNILLDDVYEDIAAIRRMMTQSQYDTQLERTRA